MFSRTTLFPAHSQLGGRADGISAIPAVARNARRRRFWLETLRVAVLSLAAALIWVAYFDRWTAESWQMPTAYWGDVYETLVRIRAAAEGDTGLLQPQVIERLGAPFGAHWNAYPTPDKLLMSVLGALSGVLGLYLTANLAMVFAQVSAAASFYLAARWLRCRWEWAWAGALLFSFTYHTFHRGLAHLSLIFTWTVPLGLLAVWLVAGSRRLAWRSPGAAVCLGAAIALGVSNPYNLFFWLQLMGWAVLAQAVGPKRRANVQLGVAAIALAMTAFFISNAERWLFSDDTEARPVLERNYAGTESYALKPVEMLIPTAYHRWDYMASFGRRYTAWSNWRGEGVMPYLGLAGIAGLGWLAVIAIRRALARRPLPPQALTVGWSVAYSTIGGVTNVLAMFASFQMFRATNRAAIFLSAILLGWLVVRLSRLTAGWPRALQLATALVVAALGVLEQLPRRTPGRAESVARTVKSDREFGAKLEAALAPGSMLFQLPQIDFPEVAPPHRLADYEHFRPYLATETLRFSYGSPRARARGGWQRELQNQPTPALVQTLEACGFAAVYLNRKGFEDDGAQLLQTLATLGYDRRIESADGEQVAVLLHPRVSPQLPLSRQLTVGRGWKIRPNEGGPWAYDTAALSYFNPYSKSITVELRLTLVSGARRQLVLELDDAPLRAIEVPAQTARLTVPSVTLAPGINQFTLRSIEPRDDPAPGSNEARAFGLKEALVVPRANLAAR